MSSQQEKVRENILHKYLENTDASKRSIAKAVGAPLTTVCRVINKFLETNTIQRKKGSGRPAGPSDKNLLKKIQHTYTQKPSSSKQDVADSLKISKSTVHRYKKHLGLRSFVAQKAAGRSESDEKVVKRRARKLYTNFLTKLDGCIIMDDETYVKNDFKQLPGKTFYVATAKNALQKKYRQVAMKKFAKKYLVWQSICSCGKKSKAFVTMGTVNKEMYMKECLEKRLLPFYKSHVSSTGKIPLFWPDLASAHYAKDTINWYEENHVK